MENRLNSVCFGFNPDYGKVQCELGWNWCPAPLQDFDLWYVVSGKGRMELGDETFLLTQGTCCLIHPGDTPKAEQDPTNRLTVIFIHFHIVDEKWGNLLERPLNLPRCTSLPETFYFEGLLNRMLTILDTYELWKEDEFDCLMKQALFHLLRLHVKTNEPINVSPKQKQMILQVSTYIREQSGHRISYKLLAELVGLSQEYLSILFKKVTGTSLKKYITQIRLERAMHLLTETAMNVSQISEVLGYSNIFLFSRQFKRHFGSPPSHFHLKAKLPVLSGKQNDD